MYLGLARFLPGRARYSVQRRLTDEHLLGGADEASVQALGASAPVLSIFSQDMATLCPDLVHEAQRAVGRRD
jgi:type IV secretory pathway TrbD component